MKKLITKRRLICFAVIAAVIIVPLLYSYFYLGAFWDPYSRLETLPVAVVNNDAGAVINGKRRNLGNEVCVKLKDEDSLKFVFTDEDTAKKGTQGKDYYAMIMIPDNFSSNIASSKTKEKQTATITYSANQKRNFLASQILGKAVIQIEESVRGSIDSEIVQQLTDSIDGVPIQLTDLQNGLDELQDGANRLKSGNTSLANGTKQFNDKFLDFSAGVASAKNGSERLSSGAKALESGLSQLQGGADTVVNSTADIKQLTTGAETLANSAKAFNDGLLQYTNGVDQLIATVNDTQTFLTKYVTTINPSIMKDPYFSEFIKKMSDPSNATSIKTLKAASTSLKDASARISTGAAQLSAGTKSLPELQSALTMLQEGINEAKAGSSSLSKGTVNLNAGLSQLNEAAEKLSGAAKDIADGTADLNNGTVQLAKGIHTAKTGVEDAVTDSNESISSLDGLADYAKAPVTVKEDNVTSIANYGTAFAPYFMSLSLWVGALILFVGVYLDTEGKFKILSRASEHKIARSFLFLIIGLIQAIALALAIQYGLGLKVDNPTLYYSSCCLVSITFIAIVQFLMVHLKDIGKLLSIVMLILQLTSCGGTFPMETVPNFFNVLYRYMPMTYSVGLFKQAITEPARGEVLHNSLILFTICAAFMALTVILSVIKTRISGKNDSIVKEGVPAGI